MDSALDIPNFLVLMNVEMNSTAGIASLSMVVPSRPRCVNSQMAPLYVSIGGLSQQLKGQEEVRVVVESRGNVDGIRASRKLK